MKIALDADPIIQSLGGGMARKIILEGGLELVTTFFTLAEAKRKAIKIAKRTGYPGLLLKMMIDAVPADVFEREDYQDYREEARLEIGKRDAGDVDILALALWLRIPIWTADKDFEVAQVETYDTPRLLKRLGWISQ